MDVFELYTRAVKDTGRTGSVHLYDRTAAEEEAEALPVGRQNNSQQQSPGIIDRRPSADRISEGDSRRIVIFFFWLAARSSRLLAPLPLPTAYKPTGSDARKRPRKVGTFSCSPPVALVVYLSRRSASAGTTRVSSNFINNKIIGRRHFLPSRPTSLSRRLVC